MKRWSLQGLDITYFLVTAVHLNLKTVSRSSCLRCTTNKSSGRQSPTNYAWGQWGPPLRPLDLRPFVLILAVTFWIEWKQTKATIKSSEIRLDWKNTWDRMLNLALRSYLRYHLECTWLSTLIRPCWNPNCRKFNWIWIKMNTTLIKVPPNWNPSFCRCQ